ncbi:ABC transporter substrate-binding protein [Ornithinimicrobium faecis]|uniref:ABC transporter substrate-binding protein n=1 Tax=Ornithinimicrobium faecis TaxID=2934158 RepID=A0ABY4YUP1_9MICO|nr:ABC transporter substrate-binding protein [Ornithinimicrobium sp. HY1793]USQ80503.1 ABC transporter substrate-binding protein [Ornithinimicrobium sp. HY1793]
MSTARSRTRLLIAGVAVVATTSACFGGASGQSGANDNAGSSASANLPEEDAGDPVPGGILEMATPSDARSLDPHREASYNTHGAIGSVYSRLTAFKTGEDVEYGTTEVEGDLAEEWEANEDSTEWTFHLREGVKFHNKPPVNGREFTSADVLCTIDRIQTLPGHQLTLISDVTDLAAPDDYTVTFSLASPNVDFDRVLANPFLVILPCEATEGDVDLDTDAIGTGAFVLDSWTRDRERVLSANPDYFIEDRPYLDGYHVTIMPDAQSQQAALRSGKLDLMAGLSIDARQVDTLLSQVEGLRLRQEGGSTQTRIYLNTNEEPFDDLNVRRAVALAIDREGMIEGLRAGGSLTGPVTPSFEGALTSEEVGELTPYDPEQAKELLAEAGFPDGFSAEMKVTDGYGGTVVKEAQWVQQDLAEVGIDVDIKMEDYATYYGDSWAQENYTIAYGLQTPMLSADEYLTSEYLSDGGRNWNGVDDPKLDEMIKEQRTITDAAERDAALQEIQRYIITEVAAPLSLYVYDGQTMLSGAVQGYYPHPDYSSREYMDIWLVDGGE